MLSLAEINELEISETYPAAIEALEKRLEANPKETETIIRLGFNYWLMAEQGDRIRPDLPQEEYAVRFMALFNRYKEELRDNADFCYAYGLGISLFWYYFSGATEELGNNLLRRASTIDSFYKRLLPPNGPFLKWKLRFKKFPSDEEKAERFSGRGILASYNNVV